MKIIITKNEVEEVIGALGADLKSSLDIEADSDIKPEQAIEDWDQSPVAYSRPIGAEYSLPISVEHSRPIRSQIV